MLLAFLFGMRRRLAPLFQTSLLQKPEYDEGHYRDDVKRNLQTGSRRALGVLRLDTLLRSYGNVWRPPSRGRGSVYTWEVAALCTSRSDPDDRHRIGKL
jgi:hypothetical protein